VVEDLSELLAARFPRGLDGTGRRAVYRLLTQAERPPGTFPLWRGCSFYMWSPETGELWEVGPRFHRQVPGRWFYEFQDLRVDEVSLCDVPACQYARIAMWK
jgi:hypothetical protein